jgi:hypothetical protein
VWTEHEMRRHQHDQNLKRQDNNDVASELVRGHGCRREPRPFRGSVVGHPLGLAVAERRGVHNVSVVTEIT